MNLGIEKQDYTVISLFAGCGGSSLGYKWAGFKELLAIDFDKNAIETFKLNFPKIPTWQKDIKKIKGTDILNFCNIKRGELDVLDGSPPCQGFSTAGKRKVYDKRNDLVLEYIRLVDELQPKVFIMENVSGMIKGTMKGLFKEYMLKMKELNYEVKCKLMNAKYYNVPQSRERLIWIGFRKDLHKNPIFPIPNKKIITVKETFKGIINSQKCLEEANFRKKSIYKYWLQIKEGDSHPKRFSLKRIDRSKPALTLNKTGGNGAASLCHYYEPRYLTEIELKRISSFPDDFKFIGKLSDKYNKIGNSVPPLFMKAIAQTVKNTLSN